MSSPLWLRAAPLVAFALALAPARAQTTAPALNAAQRPADFDPKAVTRPPPPPAPPLQPPVLVPDRKTSRLPSGGPKFRVKTLVITGTTVLAPEEKDRIRALIEGKDVALDYLSTITARIEELYRKKGYFLARAAIPPQEVTAGIVTIVVSEGRYGKLTIEGNKHYPTAFLERFFAPALRGGLVRERPLLTAVIQLNQLKELSAQTVFSPGTKPGTADVLLRVHDDRPLHISTDYNNFGNRLVGRNRFGISLEAGRAFTDGDELILRVVEPFPGKSDPFYQGSYSRPWNHHYDRVGLLFASARSRVRGRELDQLQIRGTADIAGVTWQRPLESKPDALTTANASLQIKNLRNFVLNDQITSRDNLRMFTGGLSTSRRKGKQRLIGAALLTQGTGTFLDGSPNGEDLRSRVGAGNGFTKLGLDGTVIRQTRAEEFLVLRSSAQLATRPLAVAEQFAIGGPDSVRGYTQSEILGDDGYGLSAELRRTLVTRRSNSLQGAVFLDHARAFLHRPQRGEAGSRGLTGAGAGLRAYFSNTSSVRLDLGLPLYPERNNDGDDMLFYAQASHRY